MRIVFHKCVQKSVQEKTSEKDSKFDYFKKKVLEHLASLQDKEHEEVKKAILDAENLQKAGYPVGTIREWKGRKYIKVAPNKWRPKYDSNSRGAKLSIAALKRKADACESSEELLQLILENRERFSDDKGRPLPFVKELSDYVSARNDKIEGKKQKDTNAKENLENYMKGKKYYEGFKVNVKNGYVSVEKDGIESTHKFIYDADKKDGHGDDWNEGALSNLVHSWKHENEEKESEVEKHQNRSDAMKGNQNAKKDGTIEETFESNGYKKTDDGSYYNAEKDIAFVPSKELKGRYDVFVHGINRDISLHPDIGFEKMETTALYDKELYDREIDGFKKDFSKLPESKIKGIYDKLKKQTNTIQIFEINGKSIKMRLQYALDILKDILKGKKKEENPDGGNGGDEPPKDDSKKLKTATKEEVKQFLKDAINTKEERRISLGNVSDSAKERIKDKTGKDVNRIILDSGEIRHAMKKPEHHINLSDLERIGEIVNSTNEITLEDEKHQNNDVIRFVEEVENGINLIMEFRARKGDLSLVTAYREKRADAPMKNPGQTSETLRTSDSNISQSGKNSSGISDIRKKYESSKSVEGNKKTVTLPDGTKIKCHYKLVEADAPTASHDEVSYAPTKGFPKNENGQNINDRDYQNDKDAQESVRKIAANFNSLALESPPIVTKDGIVISGNNRTMSSKLAAKNGTDKAYLNDLRDMIDEYGLEESDLDGFKNPRLILEVDEEHKGDYTTEEFAQFNRDTKKTMSNVEKAVKLTKTLNEEKISSIAGELSNYDTMSDLYNDATGCQKFVSKLIEAGIIGDNEKAQYCKSDGTLNDTGKDFVETVLVGSVLNENNIRKLDSAGGKRIRQKLVRAILPLIENKGNGKEYSFNNELNEAVDIAVNVAKDHKTYPDVETYLAQGSLFGEKKPDEVTGKLAKLIHDEGEKAFANRMKDLGTGLQQSANGEMDIFIGGVESKQSLMEKFLEIKKSVQELLTNIVRKEQTTRQLVAEVLSDIA
jgi:hypothetical protein